MPPLARAKGLPEPAVGGWMYSSLKRIQSEPDITVAVGTVYSGKEFEALDVDGVRYFLLPMGGRSFTKYNSGLEKYWKNVQQNFLPDVVHIHGSEYPHGLAYIKACGACGVVLSIQGIISRCARYYAAGIDFKSIKKCLTFRDIVKNESVFKCQRSFEERGHMEVALIQSLSHIIGRTDWDRDQTWAINPEARYHYCGETLRDSFYRNTWRYSDCEPHSMFVSQASYPIKGVHMLFEAMPYILRHYPDARIYVAGSDPTAAKWYRLTGYGKYLRQQISRLNIADHIHFTGMLSEEAMCERYLKSNVFVCCSSIENSPNSLGEAQLLGMPYVASFVGGVPEITMMNRRSLYRFEEVEMLAAKICEIFAEADNISPTPYDASRYDAGFNTATVLDIYKTITDGK